MTDEQAILETLEEYAAAYCTKDIVRQMAIFDDGDDISVIGTGTDELCAGRADIQALFLRNFSSATATKFQWYWKNVTLRDGCAVVAVSLTIHLDTNEGPVQVARKMDCVAGEQGWKMEVVTQTCIGGCRVSGRRKCLPSR